MKDAMDAEPRMRYRLGLDLGTTSLGWAILRLDKENHPCAVVKAGVRIFSNGCDAKTGESLAVQRRLARQQRRTRDRALRRKNYLISALIKFGFFPKDEKARKKLEKLNPYELRKKGLDFALKPEEFARALFHLAQRRGFKSNRKTDSHDAESGKMKSAISNTREKLIKENCRTVGEWLYERFKAGIGTRARTREVTNVSEGKGKKSSIYDLYLDREMISDEFEKLWQSQERFNPTLFSKQAHNSLRDIVFYQRDLRSVLPGVCTLIPSCHRAALALPSQQRFRIYQEVNNLRKLDSNLAETELSLEERDKIIALLERSKTVSFDSIKKKINYQGDFNLEDVKRKELKGNVTSATLGKKSLLGSIWFDLPYEEQDEIVQKLLDTQSENELVDWLKEKLSIEENLARKVSFESLPKGYGRLSLEAIRRILPILQSKVITYDKAVVEAGLGSHSELGYLHVTGELLRELPYYGEYLTRRVGYGTGDEKDPPEKRFGKIANPTVHIGLNQVRVVVNSLLRRYGRPSEIIIELARDLKLSREKKTEIMREQALRQKKRKEIRSNVAKSRGCKESAVSETDITKWLLWEELNPKNALERCCPYSGKQISVQMLLSDAVEIEHILPFSRTLDNSFSNKTVSIREANRIKGNRTPWEAKDDFEKKGWSFEGILSRAERMDKNKRMRFGELGYESWLNNQDGFVARALTDTQYMGVVAKEYLGLICPKTHCIPGRLTAMLRGKFGLNSILGSAEKNRNDHRHHAIDACVIAVTDQSLLQRVSTESAKARENNCGRLLNAMPLPWPSFYQGVKNAIGSIKVSHKPDHGYQGAMHDQTARGFLPNGETITHAVKEGKRVAEIRKMELIPITCQKATARHGLNPDGSLRAYKGYKGNSNYCIEISSENDGKWKGTVVSTFEAYQIVKKSGEFALRKSCTQGGKPLVMRLMINDTIKIGNQIYLVNTIRQSGNLELSPIYEANVSKRNRDDKDSFKFLNKSASSLRSSNSVQVSVTPDGRVRKVKK